MNEAERDLPARVAKNLGWTRTSYVILSAFMAVILAIVVLWWPLLADYVSYYNPAIPWWRQADWLLLAIFLAMTLLVMARADVRADLPLLLVGLAGGGVIETWGTRSELWAYYTGEQPPLWILPAWPIASLAIDRLYRMLRERTQDVPEGVFKVGYWLAFPVFFGLMLAFTRPTWDAWSSVGALLIVAVLVVTPTDHRTAVLIFVAGSGLGYFLERWGTTRQCWVYYTRQTPPLFAVLAHGLASVAFWRALVAAQWMGRLSPGWWSTLSKARQRSGQLGD